MIEISFILTAYNHQAYVRQAVQGALAQDYQPLEIIISDDCSTDDTFPIIEDEVKRYRGPHEVLLNRNERNLGEPGHNQKLALMARGKFLVMANGDDISTPHRTRRLSEIWRKHNYSLITSNATLIDKAGNNLSLLNDTDDDRETTIEEIIEGWNNTRLGATLAQEKELYTTFPELSNSKFPLGIDHILPFRAALLRGAYYLNQPLIYYRQHDQNFGRRAIDDTQDKLIRQEGYAALHISINVCMLEDLDSFISSRTGSQELKDIRVKVCERSFALCRRLARIRNELYALGKRPTWIDKEKLNSRALRSNAKYDAKVRSANIVSHASKVNQFRPTFIKRISSLWRLIHNRN